MGLQPTFTPRAPEWRGNTSSEEMNSNFEEILYDLNTIFSEASTIVVELNKLESKIRHEVSALSNRLYAVSGLISTYDQAASGYKMVHEDFYLSENITYPDSLPEEEKCVLDTELGTVTLPVVNSFSKVYTLGMADGEVTISPDLKVEITPQDELGNIKIDELNPKHAFDGQDDTVWERKVKFNRDYVKDAVECKLEATLPSMSNPYVNKFIIKPYPEGTVDVTDVTYDTLISQDNVLPTFPSDGENNIRSKMYSFDNIQPTKFKVYLRQRNNALEDDYKTFTYGAKEIGIEKVEYRDTGKIAVKLSLPDYETGLFKHITSLTTDPEYDNITYKVSLYPTDTDFQADIARWTSYNSPITTTNQLDVEVYATESIWIMIELTKESGTSNSPLLNSITMTYTTTD